FRMQRRNDGRTGADGTTGRKTRLLDRRRRTVKWLERLEDRTLLTFTPIVLPASYTGTTTNLQASIPANGTSINTLSDGIETLTFSSQVTAGTVPLNFATWGSPPNTESSTPRVLTSLSGAGATSLGIILSHPANQFGFELEPNAGGA